MLFQFMLEVDTTRSVRVTSIDANLMVRFRHFAPAAIEIGVGGAPGKLNLGFRLRSLKRPGWSYEDRCVFMDDRLIEPDVWTPCFITIPRSAIEFGEAYTLHVDVVQENEYWFSDRRTSGELFNIDFIDVKDQQSENLGLSQMNSLRDLLTKATARIAQLEHAERVSIAERGDLRAKIRAADERASRSIVSEGLLPPLSARIDGLISSVDVIERRDIWLSELSRMGAEGPVFSLYPHDRQPGHPAILVTGSGGFGDMLYITPVIRELSHLFATRSIFVLHENAHANVVFDSNPYVAGVVKIAPSSIRDFMHVASSLDIFDLIVDVRYAVTYSCPPLSRMPEEFVRRALYSAAEWQRFVRFSWPQLNNLLAKKVVARGMSKLDLMGATSLLPIDKKAEIDLFVESGDMCRYDELRARPYITVHHGADPRMALGKSVQTKNLSLASWQAIVAELRAAGYTIVQVGGSGETIIPGIHYDLRGATNFAQSAHVIKMASCHVDTEGGLVHVCRAVQNRSVVAFGPTPVAFFGYEANVNLGATVCSDCWWTTGDWAARCPRGLELPECMESHDASAIAANAIRIAGTTIVAQIIKIEPIVDARSTATIAGLLRAQAGDDGATGCLLINGVPDFETLPTISEAGLPDFDLIIPEKAFGAVAAAAVGDLRVLPCSLGNIPMNSSSYAWGVGCDIDVRNAEGLSFCADLARCIRHEGSLIITSSVREGSLSMLEWAEHIRAASLQIMGRRYEVASQQDLAGYGERPERASAVQITIQCRHVGPEQLGDAASHAH
jgi:ADP-heptose:LPS heptosyltransferase